MVEPEAIQPEVIAEKATQAPQALSTFNFNSNALRVVELEGEPWFVTKDVCQTLGIKPTTSGSYAHHLRKLEAHEKLTLTKKVVLKTTQAGLFDGCAPSVSLINESGLYEMVLKSRKSQASAFRRWVTQEVLPSIRKTGAYVMGQAPTAETGSTDLMKQQLALLSGVLDKPKSGLILTTFIKSVSY